MVAVCIAKRVGVGVRMYEFQHAWAVCVCVATYFIMLTGRLSDSDEAVERIRVVMGKMVFLFKENVRHVEISK